MSDRFLIPRRGDEEGAAAMAAIIARLQEFDEPTIQWVRLTYWCDDFERPVDTVIISSQVIWRWRATVPLTATHMTIEG